MDIGWNCKRCSVVQCECVCWCALIRVYKLFLRKHSSYVNISMAFADLIIKFLSQMVGILWQEKCLCVWFVLFFLASFINGLIMAFDVSTRAFDSSNSMSIESFLWISKRNTIHLVNLMDSEIFYCSFIL